MRTTKVPHDLDGYFVDDPPYGGPPFTHAVKDSGSRIRQNLEVLRRAGQSLATSGTSFVLFLRVKILNGVAVQPRGYAMRKRPKVVSGL